jgi:hypothetical protein
VLQYSLPVDLSFDLLNTFLFNIYSFNPK